VPSTTLNAFLCMMAQKIDSFISVTIHAWRCACYVHFLRYESEDSFSNLHQRACYVHLQINIHKMANQFQRFRDTFFLVYKFQWSGPTACSGTCNYNLTQYPAYAHLNSQIAEQFNSTVNLLVLQHKSGAVSATRLSGPSCSMSDSSCSCRTKRL